MNHISKFGDTVVAWLNGKALYGGPVVGEPTNLCPVTDWDHSDVQTIGGCRLCGKAPQGFARKHCSWYCNWPDGHSDMCEASYEAELREDDAYWDNAADVARTREQAVEDHRTEPQPWDRWDQ